MYLFRWNPEFVNNDVAEVEKCITYFNGSIETRDFLKSIGIASPVDSQVARIYAHMNLPSPDRMANVPQAKQSVVNQFLNALAETLK